ncbi:MAG: tetratricopeptide repeat protein [Undibacterium umbellatum]|uniref:tetratricopeptide repeat protein n=1 Tax=Undibacterium umbellatum TaxID=2762300 RepID=UPI003BB81364
MDLYVTESEVRQLEQRLTGQVTQEQLHEALTLAWHLRQRDSGRALVLCEDISKLLNTSSRSDTDKALIYLRMQLIRAEEKWLHADLDGAAAIVQAILRHPDVHLDRASLSDAHRMLGFIFSDQGKHVECDIEMAISIDEASKADDMLRKQSTAAALARVAVLRDDKLAKSYFDRHFDSRNTPKDIHPGLAALMNDFLGLHAGLNGHLEESGAFLNKAFELCLDSGQIRRAILTAANIGYNYSIANDFESALEWLQKALKLAKPTGWSPSIGNCLMQIGDTLRKMGSLDAAEHMLHEALEQLAKLTNSRNYALTISVLADVALDRRDYHLALNLFTQLTMLPGAQEQADLQETAIRGQAKAQAKLKSPLRETANNKSAALAAKR